MKFLQGIKARLADGAAAPLSRSLGITSDAEDANTTNDCNDPRPLLKLGPFAFPSSYPSLYGEANDMISLSNLIYVLVDVRDLARNGTNNGSTATVIVLGESSAERILNTPLPLADVARIVTAEADVLKARLNAETHAATLAALAGLTTTAKATSTGATTTTTMNDETLKEETAANDDEDNNNNNNNNNNNTGGLFNLFTSWCGVGSGLGSSSNSSLFNTDEGAIATSGGDGGEPLRISMSSGNM